MKRNMTDEEFKEFISHIDSDILPVRSRLTKEEEEEARREEYAYHKEWTERNAE